MWFSGAEGVINSYQFYLPRLRHNLLFSPHYMTNSSWHDMALIQTIAAYLEEWTWNLA